MKTIDCIQQEQYDWQLVNFGHQRSHRALLGMIEELGELSHARLKMEQKIRGTNSQHIESQKDSIGDFTIYTMGFCSATELSLSNILCRKYFNEYQDIFNSILNQHDNDYEILFDATYYLGKICKWNKKSYSKIEDNIGHVFSCLAIYCSINEWNMQNIVESTWDKVSKRNWKHDPVSGSDLDSALST